LSFIGEVSLRSVTRIENPNEFWLRWDDFVRNFSANALYLGGFVSYYCMIARQQGWTPQLIEMTVDGKLVGIATLRTKGILGARRARSLMPPACGADFVVDPIFREEFVSKAVGFILKKLRCQFLDLTIAAESPNLEALRKACKFLGPEFEAPAGEEHFREHSVLRVQGTWEEFKSRKGKDFARHYERIERKLGSAGRWQVTSAAIDGPDTVKKINAIESNSWKSTWRREKGVRADENLVALLDYWKSESSRRGGLPRVWLLELNGNPIAYEIACQLNGVVLQCKTSYDDRYKEFSPGDFIIHAAIRDLFDSGKVTTIDFLAKIPSNARWTSLVLQREIVTVSRTIPVVSTLVTNLGKNRYVRAVRAALRN
jgi:hypothetical protein